jgi:hypothetical protein
VDSSHIAKTHSDVYFSMRSIIFSAAR